MLRTLSKRVNYLTPLDIGNIALLMFASSCITYSTAQRHDIGCTMYGYTLGLLAASAAAAATQAALGHISYRVR